MERVNAGEMQRERRREAMLISKERVVGSFERFESIGSLLLTSYGL